VLFGNYNPSGKLPLTYYKSVTDLPEFDNYDITNGRTYMYFDKKPLYPFGHGLSYTRFEYSGLTTDKDLMTFGDTLKINVHVKNAGKYNGEEVVQLYIYPPRKFDFLPKQQLKAFKKIKLTKGENESVSFSLHESDFSFWTSDTQHQLVEGSYTVLVGSSSGDIRCTKEILVTK